MTAHGENTKQDRVLAMVFRSVRSAASFERLADIVSEACSELGLQDFSRAFLRAMQYLEAGLNPQPIPWAAQHVCLSLRNAVYHLKRKANVLRPQDPIAAMELRRRAATLDLVWAMALWPEPVFWAVPAIDLCKAWEAYRQVAVVIVEQHTKD